MKRRFVLYILFIALLILSGCDSKHQASESPVRPSQTYDVISPGETAQTEETPPRLDGLYSGFDAALDGRDFTLALTIVDQIIAEYPDEKNTYMMKVGMLIESIKYYQNELNQLIEGHDVNSENYFEDMAAIKDEYENADISLVIPFIPDSIDSSRLNTVGCSQTDLTSGIWLNNYSEFRVGTICTQDDWIYYVNVNEKCALYKMKTDSSQNTLVTNAEACNLNVIGDWIYFTNISENEQIYKIRTDGQMLTFVSDTLCAFMVVYDGYIYYSDKNSNYSVCRMKTDGSDVQNFGYDAQSIHIVDDLMFFLTESRKIMTMSLDGTNAKQLISDDAYGNFYINEDSIYYMTIMDGLTIFKCDRQGQNKEQIYKTGIKINFYYIVTGKLLLSVRNADKVESLILIDLSDMSTVMQIDYMTTNNIVYLESNKWILCMDEYSNYAWCKLDLVSNTVSKID